MEQAALCMPLPHVYADNGDIRPELSTRRCFDCEDLFDMKTRFTECHLCHGTNSSIRFLVSHNRSDDDGDYREFIFNDDGLIGWLRDFDRGYMENVALQASVSLCTYCKENSDIPICFDCFQTQMRFVPEDRNINFRMRLLAKRVHFLRLPGGKK